MISLNRLISAHLSNYNEACCQPKVAAQVTILRDLFIIASFMTSGVIAWSAGFIGEWLKKSEKAQVIMNRIAGTVFAGLALRLAITER